MKKRLLKIMILSVFFVFIITGCSISSNGDPNTLEKDEGTSNTDCNTGQDRSQDDEKNKLKSIEYIKIVPDYRNSRYKEIYLAGGCFWGFQAYFDRILGVEYTNVGYANGNSEETDYNSVKKTGHAETVYVVYDPDNISLEELLGYFYENIEPTSLINQNSQYRSGIYYLDEEDKKIIDSVTEKVQENYDEDITVQIQPLNNYVLAEDYHQDYLGKSPGGYSGLYISESSRVKPKVILEDYPKPTIEEIRKKLTDMQFNITQESFTESPFQNEYWDNKEEGLYTDIVTGEPLFLSIHKYDSGSGWPSFTRPIQWDVLRYYEDGSMGMIRIEVRSRSGDSHLGHLFHDGPVQEGKLRYCINSGSMDFIPLDDLDEQGYGKFKIFFK